MLAFFFFCRKYFFKKEICQMKHNFWKQLWWLIFILHRRWRMWWLKIRKQFTSLYFSQARHLPTQKYELCETNRKRPLIPAQTWHQKLKLSYSYSFSCWLWYNPLRQKKQTTKYMFCSDDLKRQPSASIEGKREGKAVSLTGRSVEGRAFYTCFTYWLSGCKSESSESKSKNTHQDKEQTKFVILTGWLWEDRCF